MGADRRGPLAAFVIVAIIAVILLVTSVRSQAAPGWIDDQVPAAVGAMSPSAPSDLWATVGGGVGLLVRQGDLLVAKGVHVVASGASATTSTSSATADEGPAPTGSSSVPSLARGHHVRPGPQSLGTQVRRHHAGPPAGVTGGGDAARQQTGRAVHDHGRHLGWSRTDHSGHPGGSATTSATPEDHGHPTGKGHGHGNHGQGYGVHGQGHGHGLDAPTAGVTPGNGHGHHYGWDGPAQDS